VDTFTPLPVCRWKPLKAPHLPVGAVPSSLAGKLVVIGRDSDGYWMLEIDERNGASFYESDGFHAVGSGSVAAQVSRSLLAHYEPLGRSVRHLRLIAYRAVSVCIGTLGGQHMVGGDVRIWEVEGDASFVKLGEAEMAQVANGVDQWRTIESETLDQVVVEEPQPEGEELPENLGGSRRRTRSRTGGEPNARALTARPGPLGSYAASSTAPSRSFGHGSEGLDCGLVLPAAQGRQARGG
jgi:hypothetical protein